MRILNKKRLLAIRNKIIVFLTILTLFFSHGEIQVHASAMPSVVFPEGFTILQELANYITYQYITSMGEIVQVTTAPLTTQAEVNALVSSIESEYGLSAWTQTGTEVSTIIDDALLEYRAFPVNIAEACAITIGSALFAYGMYKGIDYVGTNTTQTALVLGRQWIEDVSNLDSEMQRYIVNTINQYSENGADAYANNVQLYSSRLMDWFDRYSNNWASAEEMVNAGFVNSEVMANAIRATSAQVDFISSKGNSVLIRSVSKNWIDNPNSLGVINSYLVQNASYISLNGSGNATIVTNDAPLSGFTFVQITGGSYAQTGPTTMTSFSLGGINNFELDFGGLPVYDVDSNPYLKPFTKAITIPQPETTPEENKPFLPNVGLRPITIIDPTTAPDIAEDVQTATDAQPETVPDTPTDMDMNDNIEDFFNEYHDINFSPALKNGLDFLKWCVSHIWGALASNGAIEMITIPLVIGLVASAIGLYINNKKS